jgi:hypothetical protein
MVKAELSPVYTERLEKAKIETYALMSFYSFPADAPQSIEKLLATIETVKPLVNHIVVVNDGGAILKNQIPDYVKFIDINAHIGKAAAFREGYRYIVGKSNNPKDVIIQTDTDFDQNPEDTSLFIQKYSELIERGNKKILLIGDRYHNMPENRVRYRQDILAINRDLTRQFNYTGIADIQSGFRAYNVGLAQEFVNSGNSYRYGLEAEQTTIALINKSDIQNVYLSSSRLRTASTDPDKWIENTYAILSHSRKLNENPNYKLTAYLMSIEKANEAMIKRQDARVNICGKEYYFFLSAPQKYSVVSIRN